MHYLFFDFSLTFLNSNLSFKSKVNMKRQQKPLPSYFELCTLKLYLQKNGFALRNLSQKKTEKVCPSVKPRGEGGQRGPTRQKNVLFK